MTQPLTESELMGVESYVADMDPQSLLDKAARGELTPLERAQVSINMVESAGERVAQAVAEVQRLEDERPLVKARCILEMIGSPNPLGKPGAVHSASSAEAVVEEHKAYWDHRQAQRTAEVEKHRAFAQLDAAKLRAELDTEVYVRGVLT